TAGPGGRLTARVGRGVVALLDGSTTIHTRAPASASSAIFTPRRASRAEEELAQLVVLRARVGAPELDQLAGVRPVEEQVAREVGGIRALPDVEDAEQRAAELPTDRGALAPQDLRRQPAEILARPHHERAYDATLDAAARERNRVRAGDEVLAVGGHAIAQQVVDALELLEVGPDVVQEERVENLAEQERKAGVA